MAFKVANVVSGNYSAAASWAPVMGTPSIHASTNLTITVGGIFTQVDTAANSTDQRLGTVVVPVASWASRTITFTLQENSVDTAVTVVVNGNNVVMGQPLRIKHTGFTQTSGRTYRYKITTNSGSPTIAQSATVSQVACLSYTNASTTAPTTGDMGFVVTENSNTDILITVDTTSCIAGSNAAASVSGSFAAAPARAWDMALHVAGGTTGIATLKKAPNVDTILNLQNSVAMFSNGKYEEKPVAGVTSQVTWTPGATIGANVLYWYWGPGSLHDIQGAGLTSIPSVQPYWKSNFVSGLGTAASPVNLTPGTGSEWAVGDYVVFHPTSNVVASNYGETEYRYVISKPTADQLVLSNTAGGAENALANTHTGGYVFNQSAGKNVIWKSTDTRQWHMLFSNTSATNANSIMRWARVQDLFSSVSAARGGFCLVAGTPLIEYISIGVPGTTSTSQQVFIPVNNANTMTITGLFVFNVTTGSLADGAIGVLAINKTFVDCWVIDVGQRGWEVRGSNPTFNKCGAIACGKGGVNGLYAGWSIAGVNAMQMNDCEQHSCRLQGMLLYGGGVDNVATRFISGTLGLNGDTVSQSANNAGYNTMLFETPTIAETNLLTNNNLLLTNSEITFADVNSLAYNNYIFSPNGIKRTTGPGLADTTVTPLAYRTERLEPVTASGVKYRYNQLANVNQQFTTSGRVWVNAAALADAGFVVTADLYLPGVVEGVDAPSASVSITKTTTAASASAEYRLGAFYNGTRPRLATIVITAKNPNVTSAAYAYVGDILNGTNNVTNFSLQYKGAPSTTMFELLGDANANADAVFNRLTSVPVASGSYGQLLQDTNGVVSGATIV